MNKLGIGICVSVAVLALAACGKKEAGDGAPGTAAAPADAPAAMATATPGLGLKAGLWEMATQVEGMPQTIVTKMCMDETLTASFTTKMGSLQQGDTKCSDQTVTRNGNTIDMTAVCVDGNQRINTKVHMEMKGDTGYHQTINATFDPPTQGRSAVSTSIDGKWLGACGADMKPGDVVMPGGLKVNMYDAMKGQ